DPRKLKIELTEGAVLRDIPGAAAKLRALEALGVACALDDFGTGGASLPHLARLRPSELKIDRSLVMQLADSAPDALLVRAIVRTALGLGLKVIAEGVETVGQRDLLRKLGCHVFQGHLFARPMPAGDLERFLTRRADRGEP
ncbi:MAG TPA: EAL domain-containing protein, partial [Rubrivivax sp.]|nr:EAL domain-containing protein [Rubrivivax sp.]